MGELSRARRAARRPRGTRRGPDRSRRRRDGTPRRARRRRPPSPRRARAPPSDSPRGECGGATVSAEAESRSSIMLSTTTCCRLVDVAALEEHRRERRDHVRRRAARAIACEVGAPAEVAPIAVAHVLAVRDLARVRERAKAVAADFGRDLDVAILRLAPVRVHRARSTSSLRTAVSPSELKSPAISTHGGGRDFSCIRAGAGDSVRLRASAPEDFGPWRGPLADP